MTLKEIVASAASRELIDPEGEPTRLELDPGLDESGLLALEESLGLQLPDEYRELLRFTTGFDFHFPVDFTGRQMVVELSEFFELSLPFAGDGFGNFWVIDLTGYPTEFGPIYYHSHDAPILLFQSRNLGEFLDATFAMTGNSRGNPVDDVHEDRLHEVWVKNPGLMSQPQAMASADAQVRDFAATLDDRWLIKDMRNAPQGDGFSWGRFGPETVIRRYGKVPIFAIRKPDSKPGFFQRLFGKRP